MQTIVVTGINGFVGKHLVHELVSNKYSVIGIGREKSIDPEINKFLEKYIYQDIAIKWPEIAKPVDAIINLAGLAAIGPSFDDPQKYISLNSSIVTNMCEHYTKQAKKPRIIIVSSGAIYDAHRPMPLQETSALGFDSPYVISKILNENQAEYYRRRGLDVIVARPFNHIGPGQGTDFLVPDLLQQIKLSFKKSSKLKIGNLKTKRDYTDVRDVAKAYRLLASTPILKHSLYNICSGESHSGENILAILQKLTDTKNMAVEIDESKIRPNDPVDHFGSAVRLIQDTSWKPTISLEETLRDIVAASHDFNK